MLLSSSDIEKRNILSCLYDSGRIPVPASKLSKLVGISEKHDTCPRTRHIIKTLIKEGTPIGSCSRGYFILNTPNEVQCHLNKLLQLQVSIANRIDAIHRAAKLQKIL